MNVAGATVAMLGGDEGEAIPAPVLDEEILRQTRRDVYILDLASTPGGVDFNAAKKLERQAVLVPGLPGKVAPISAGQILTRVIPELIAGLPGR